VIDTGVNAIPDLSGKLVPGWNVVDGNSDTTDINGHGTKVASIAGGASNNGLGIASVSWNCKVMPIRAADAKIEAYTSDLAEGVVYAANNGARVVNISFFIWRNSALESALSYLKSKGGIAFCAAGNYGSNTGELDNPYVVTVSGTDSGGNWSPNSSFGYNVDVAAPYTNYAADRYGTFTPVGGTSFSTPMVAGAAALVLSINPSLSSAQVEEILKSTANDKGAPGWDPYTGWGQVNVGNAVIKAMGVVPADTILPSVAITSPAASQVVKGTVSVWAAASDNVGVDSLSLFIDGGLHSVLVGAPYTFQWNTSANTDGLYQLRAVAKDKAGNVAESSIVVTVSNFVDSIAPLISIVSPVPGARLARNSKISVSTSDNVGVRSVEAYIDGVIVGSSTTAPFTVSLNTKNISSGTHTLQCKAYDAAGNSGQSALILVRK
jgi:thermitase